MSNLLFSFNESVWQDNGFLISNKVYYYNEQLKAIVNFYFVSWLYQFVDIQKSDDPVRIVVIKKSINCF